MGRRGLPVRLGPGVNRGLLALLDQKVKLGQPGHKAQKESRAFKARRVYRAYKAKRAQQGRKVILAHKAQQVLEYHPVAPQGNGLQKRPIPIAITHGLIRHLWK